MGKTRKRTILSLLALGVAILCFGPGAAERASAADECAPSGKLHFVCGAKNVEDLVLIPGTHWIVAGGLTAPGHLYLIDAQAKASRVLYPGETPRQRPDTSLYPDCPGAPDPQKFVAHGLNIRTRAKGLATLYVVNHGGRESIELFDLDTKGAEPSATWVGCAVLPEGANPNSVALLPDGGFVVTSFIDKGKTFAQMFSGEHTGAVYEWHLKMGFHLIPGTELAGDNGIEVSRDGKQIYVAATGGKSVVRYSLGANSTKPKVAAVDFAPDNIRWRPDGKLLIAGRASEVSCGDTTVTPTSTLKLNCPHGLEVVAVNPATMKVQVLLHERADPAFTNISGALQVGGDLWLASAASDRVAYMPLE
jgi:hypothetical protein